MLSRRDSGVSTTSYFRSGFVGDLVHATIEYVTVHRRTSLEYQACRKPITSSAATSRPSRRLLLAMRRRQEDYTFNMCGYRATRSLALRE